MSWMNCTNVNSSSDHPPTRHDKDKDNDNALSGIFQLFLQTKLSKRYTFRISELPFLMICIAELHIILRYAQRYVISEQFQLIALTVMISSPN
jgi:hypothetical protein